MPKPSTIVALGWRNIGDSESEAIVVEGPLIECWKQLTQWTIETIIAKRIDIVLGRTKAEVEHRFTQSRSAKETTKELFNDEIQAMLERVPDSDADDNWVPPRLGAKDDTDSPQ